MAGLKWPARIELVQKNPPVIIDTAHNGASIKALVETLAESFSDTRIGFIDFCGVTRQRCQGDAGDTAASFSDSHPDAISLESAAYSCRGITEIHPINSTVDR